MRFYVCVLAVLVAAAGCKQSTEKQEITDVREVTPPQGATASGPSNSAERFGFKGMPGGEAAHTHAAPEFAWEKPEGWKEQPPTQFRLANFTAGDKGEVEVFLSKAGGGVPANVNRWRKQVGLPDLSEQELAELPKKPVLGGEAVFVNFDGTYTGMQGDAKKEGYKLAGVILDKDGEGIFVKMVGPAAAVEKEIQNLDKFAQSLKMNPAGATMAGDPHAGMMPGADPHAGMGGGLPGMAGAAEADFTWKAPETWQETPRPMRVASYTPGNKDAEIYVSSLSGAAGGVLANINRWRTQMGIGDALTQEQVDKLPKVTVLGKECPLVELEGSFQGMSGTTLPNAKLLGTLCELPGRVLFVKMTGPADVVNAEKDRFVAFAQSLTPKQ